jgi:hypothetical protein
MHLSAAGDAAERQAQTETGNAQRYWYQNALFAYSDAAGIYQSESGSVASSMGSKACTNAKRIYLVLKSSNWHQYLGSKYTDNCKLVEEEKKDEPVTDKPEEPKEEPTDGGTGCFVGKIYRNRPGNDKVNTGGSPAGYVRLNTLSIPPRGCEEGLPGRSDLKEWFTVDFTGSIYLEQAGDYIFKLTSDDGSKLYIDGSLVIEMDRVQATASEEGGTTLTAGYHRVNVQYFQGPCGHIALTLEMRQKGGEFRVVGCSEGKESPDCDDGDSVQLTKTYPVSIPVPHPSKKPILVQRPELATDTKTAKAAADFYGALYKAVKGGGDAANSVRTVLESASDLRMFLEKEFKDPNSPESLGYLFSSVGSIALDNPGSKTVVRVEFGAEDVDATNPLGSAVNFYLSALARTMSGVAGLGELANNRSLLLAWAIPQQVIEGECVPQMKCVNGKWAPSRDWLFKETSRKEARPEPNPNLTTGITLKQSQELTEKYFKTAIELRESNLEKYEKDPNCFCDEIAHKNFDKVDWPYDFDKCANFKTQLANVNDQIAFYEDAVKSKEAEIRNWIDVEKPQQVAGLQATLNSLDQSLVELEAERARHENLRKNFVASGDQTNATIHQQWIDLIDSQVATTKAHRATVQAELSAFTPDRHLVSLTSGLRTAQDALKQLKEKDKPALEASIKRCADIKDAVEDD